MKEKKKSELTEYIINKFAEEKVSYDEVKEALEVTPVLISEEKSS